MQVSTIHTVKHSGVWIVDLTAGGVEISQDCWTVSCVQKGESNSLTEYRAFLLLAVIFSLWKETFCQFRTEYRLENTLSPLSLLFSYLCFCFSPWRSFSQGRFLTLRLLCFTVSVYLDLVCLSPLGFSEAPRANAYKNTLHFTCVICTSWSAGTFGVWGN